MIVLLTLLIWRFRKRMEDAAPSLAAGPKTPVIFTLTLERSTASQAATSGLLCMAIVGGAILPLVVGQIADKVGLHAAFLVPMVAYAAISVFAMGAARARITTNEQAATELAH